MSGNASHCCKCYLTWSKSSEDSSESLGLQEIQPMHPEGNQPWKFTGRNWCWSSNTSATWCEELTHSKRPWRWERLKAGGEGDDIGWDGWMASPTQWTWVWASSGRWWRTGKPGMLQSKGTQRIEHIWAPEKQQIALTLYQIRMLLLNFL